MKNLLPLLGLCALATAAHAQDTKEAPSAGRAPSSTRYTAGSGGYDAGNTGFGVKGGFTLANLNGDGKDVLTNRDNINTYHVGAYGQFGFNSFASLQVEALYSRKGYRSDMGAGLADTRLDYLSVPVLFVGNITETLSFHLGPQLSVLNKVTSDGKDLDIGTFKYNSLDYGGVVGAEARIGPGRVGIRYDYSFGKLREDGATVAVKTGSTTSTVAIPNSDIRNQAFQVYVGIGFRR